MELHHSILSRSLLLDLETTPDGKILKAGVIHGAQEGFLKGRFRSSDIEQMLDELGRDAEYVLGHNILDHDLPVLRASFPRLSLHRLPVIDTLFLSPIAFPENPYHHLVKDYRLLRTAINDPVCDARNAGRLFEDQWAVFERMKTHDPGRLRFYAWAFSERMLPFFRALDVEPFTDAEASEFFCAQASQRGCRVAARTLAGEIPRMAVRETAAYVLAWLPVAGSNSILPPWVRHKFSDVSVMVRRLRAQSCADSACPYCVEHHNPALQLQRFFGFDAFRMEPRAPDGGSLQEAIIRQGLNGQPLLAILPTGGGKSLCYQLPALVHNFRRGALTVVISPLQALMKDQVDNLNRLTSSSFAAALYGLLTPPERGDVLERVRLGDVAILYVSPEQLRNVSFRNCVREREIACWVFDEAHCLSRWGHSFRPDYLYASRFILEQSGLKASNCPPVACFTATAKQDVVEEICQHFREHLSQELVVLDGGSERTNLGFEVQVVGMAEKRERVRELLAGLLPVRESGSAVVYCATRQGTEDMAKWLQKAGLSAEAFHAGLEAPEKRRIQDAFIAGDIQHICATNAFGMGIDKDNVRLVIHADIPGSLESYFQEAGRAGRDRQMARCILLYDPQDIETQFSLSAFSRLTRHDIAQILRGLRRAKRDENNSVVITAGEILRDEAVSTEFTMMDPMAATMVNTAISMLERGHFVQRNENRTQVLQVRPLVRSMEEAQQAIDARSDLSQRTKKQWMAILGCIFNSNTEGISVDHLAELPSLARVTDPSKPSQVLHHDTLPVLHILNDMVQARIIEKDTLLSAYVKVRCQNASEKTLAHICAIEKAMLAILRETEPDPEGWLALGLRHLNQRLLDEGFTCAPETLRGLLNSLVLDGQGLAGSHGSIELKYQNKEHYRVKVKRSWDNLIETALKRQTIAALLLQALVRKIEPSSNGEHLVKFNESEMLNALQGDLLLAPQIKNLHAAFERGLLFLHEQKVIILQQGLAVFRQAMTITILPEAKGRSFTSGDFSSLREHYRERNFQIHVMKKYADLGLEKIKNALALVAGYFTMGKVQFVQTFFAGEEAMLERATSAESYQKIVDHLNNAVQAAVVAARPGRNMLVLAGPGSGKTRVIAHRCAYLLRVERVRPREILVLCFNRAAAVSLRQRIRDLVGREASGVTIQTYHALAMRLIGASLSARAEKGGELPALDQMIPTAVQYLRGECDIPGLERDEIRDRLVAGYRHILIDEYQDIDRPQYELISAIAGRTLDSSNADAKLSILAVGDDDQNIYAFRGANVQFIREFERDYEAKIHYLIENYRSTAPIIDAANRLIAQNQDRMKREHPIQINSARLRDPPGHPVEIAACNNPFEQARFVLQSVMAARQAGEGMAIFARTREELHPIRAALESQGIPAFSAADKASVPLHLLREAHSLLRHLKQHRQELLRAEEIQEAFRGMSFYDLNNPWCRLLEGVLEEWKEETNNRDRMGDEAMDYLYEALHALQREPCPEGSVYLSTVHAAKGLEFDRVTILGHWPRPHTRAQQEEERRLFYVGMTRARKRLCLCELAGLSHPFIPALNGPEVRRLRAGVEAVPADDVLQRRYALLDASCMWLSYPARAPDGGQVRQYIARLRPGSPVRLQEQGERIIITDAQSHKIGVLSAQANEEWHGKLSAIQEVRVHAVIHWCREFEVTPSPSGPDEWEVPLLEVMTKV